MFERGFQTGGQGGYTSRKYGLCRGLRASGVDLGEGCTGVRTPVGLGQQGFKGGAKNQYYYNRSKCTSL